MGGGGIQALFVGKFVDRFPLLISSVSAYSCCLVRCRSRHPSSYIGCPHITDLYFLNLGLLPAPNKTKSRALASLTCFFVTSAFNTNTIWIESEFDKADYSPMNLNFGQAVIFDSGLTHGNKVNIENLIQMTFMMLQLKFYSFLS